MSTATNAPAPPNDALVIRQLDAHTTIFSQPFSRGPVPFGGRSTAIKLRNGDVWLAASHPLDPATLKTITDLGDVKHIVVFDSEHKMFTKQYTDAFPSARLYFPPKAAAQWRKQGLITPEVEQRLFTYGTQGSVGNRPDPFEESTGGEIKSADFTHAHVNEVRGVLERRLSDLWRENPADCLGTLLNRAQDIAFFHVPTKTVIEADLLMNLPPSEQYSKTSARSTLPWLSHAARPGTKTHQRFVYHLAATNKAEMRAAARQVAGWDFDRIIPCHGDVIETGGKKAWTDTYAWFLEGN
ncbi:hypothetical protein Rhopal_007871-T1 [Rhodotorula paludigena]|uniref:Uncharacterized protein n=1 Tax=Rhodotorula paludigena TaxID=86838 RepID=A0AAV5GW60_9BASI|nr:hypothetical protein Rhopal_007871-T1 [Rhodotorula paludigena]